MSSWREYILKEFAPQAAQLTLVADPDGLLLEEGILAGIRERGFVLMPFEDHVAFRYAYESQFRSRWDRGEATNLVVALHSPANNLSSLPYDLLQAGRRLSFNLGDIFPNLSYPVVTMLDRSDLDVLYQAQQQNPDTLGDNATRDFILRYVFEVIPELIKEASGLLRALLRRHYRGQRLPTILDERFIQVLHNSGRFADWPLEQIVPDRQAFFAFLQERWPVFLETVASQGRETVSNVHAADRPASYVSPAGHFVFSGPVDLPFDHNDVRVYIDNLFFDGLLQPVSCRQSAWLASQWVAVGIHTDPPADRRRRLDSLMTAVQATLPAPDARYPEWLLFAYRWAELIGLLWAEDAGRGAAGNEWGEQAQTFAKLQAAVDHVFLQWVMQRYAGLHNLPSCPPVMLHHIPRFLATLLIPYTASRTSHAAPSSSPSRVACIVVDGLALDQWLVLRHVLQDQRPAFCLSEGAVFAWLPTITSVSRQAMFAGKPPLYFPASLHSTDKEALLWRQFWVDQGLAPKEVGYLKGLGDGDLEAVSTLLAQPSVRAIGLVVDKVDRIMHGMELGTAGMHNQVRQWAMQGYLACLLDILLEHDFQVILTSDHGNVEAEGLGRPAEGVIADLRGERVRVYPDRRLRAGVKARFPEAIEWPVVGLPDDFLPLLAPGRRAFIRQGERLVAHGGISLEELIVPLVQIERRVS